MVHGDMNQDDTKKVLFGDVVAAVNAGGVAAVNGGVAAVNGSVVVLMAATTTTTPTAMRFCCRHSCCRWYNGSTKSDIQGVDVVVSCCCHCVK